MFLDLEKLPNFRQFDDAKLDEIIDPMLNGQIGTALREQLLYRLSQGQGVHVGCFKYQNQINNLWNDFDSNLLFFSVSVFDEDCDLDF